MYHKLNNKILTSLAGIVGKDNIFTATDDISQYASDETPGVYYPPEAVVRPTESGQIYEIIKLANSENFPIIPRGGGTGLSGGALAVMGGLIISFELLNHIIDMDPRNRMAVVQPGVINGVLQKEAEKLNLFYPVNPASMDSCTMGGNVAESTGGANTVRYGTTLNYLKGIKSITGGGEIWQAGGKIVKNSTDQHLIQLMCGSEGTLSIFTELTFHLISKPLHTTWIIAPFKDIYKIPLVAENIFKLNFNPTMVELMDSKTLKYTELYLKSDIQFSSYHQLLIRFDCDDKKEMEKKSLKAGELCLENGAEDVLVADTKKDQEKIWKIRSALHDAIVQEGKTICEEDVVVPVAEVANLIKKIYSISNKHNTGIAIFGHLGDGNIHLNFTGKRGRTARNCSDFITGGDEKKISKLLKDVFETAISLGGKLSGEHGIGITKKPYFKRFIDPGYIKLLQKIKTQFDPNYILNPGKILSIQ